MSDLTEPHDPVHDCDCQACACHERDRLREEVEQLKLAEEGAKEAFGHVVQDKRKLEAECTRLRGLLKSAYDDIRRAALA